jgi:precorrin-3B methylase
MSTDGVKAWLTALMLDENLMEAARRDVSATYTGFDPTDQERAYLTSPATIPRPEELDSLVALTITAIRPQILVRTPYTTFPKPIRPNLIAFVPPTLALSHATRERQTTIRDESATASPAEVHSDARVELATHLIDDLFAGFESSDLRQTQPQRLLNEAHITIVGLGMRSLDQLTREAERALLAAQEVFLVDGSLGIKDYLLSKQVKVTDLCELYKEGKGRLETYKEMSKAVVEAAIKHGPVALGLYGHPTVFAFPPFVIKDVADQLGLTVKILPGISSMDCIFAEMMIDPANAGMQMFEATELLLTRRKIQTDIQTLIWQVGTLETGLYSSRPSSPNRFARFVEYLTQYFPPAHPCVAIYCSDHPALPSTTLRFPLDRIGEFATQLHGGFTLYLPPAAVPPTLDSALERSLNSTQHLSEVTQSSINSTSGAGREA